MSQVWKNRPGVNRLPKGRPTLWGTLAHSRLCISSMHIETAQWKTSTAFNNLKERRNYNIFHVVISYHFLPPYYEHLVQTQKWNCPRWNMSKLQKCTLLKHAMVTADNTKQFILRGCRGNIKWGDERGEVGGHWIGPDWPIHVHNGKWPSVEQAA